LQGADSPRRYLERALFLLPCDAGIWYAAGARDLSDGRSETAWRRWRRSLECSDRYLPQILASCATRIGPAETAEKVLPENPALLLTAARQLADISVDAKPLLEKALRLLAAQVGPLSAGDLHLKAQAHRALEQTREALAAYQAALDERPDAPEWRYEFADLLHRQGRLQDARRELNTILAGRPGYDKARELHKRVLREIAEED
jgi:tetratricopeptide (TPR) repeat protein